MIILLNNDNNNCNKYSITIVLFIIIYIFSIIDKTNSQTTTTTTTTFNIYNYNNSNSNNLNRPILKYNKDNKFKIVQFTDLHYGENLEKDLLNSKAQETILDYENPDFVIFSGDLLSGWLYKTLDQYLDAYQLITEPLIKRGIPWSIAMGNHDCEGILSCLELSILDRTYNLSLTDVNLDTGISGLANYVLNIFPKDFNSSIGGSGSSGSGSGSGNNNSISNSNQDYYREMAKSFIYIFDSETEGCKKRDHYGCIQKDQVEWYKNISNQFNRKESIAFVHIPPYEIIDVYNNDYVTGDFKEKEICCYYTSESKFITTMVEQGDIKGLYFGHDHLNDFHGDFNGVDLGYGRKTGYGSYGPYHTNGARVFELTAEPQFKIQTWIRDINGLKDMQKVQKSKYFDKLDVICCVPGDPRSKQWFNSMLGLLMVGFAFIIISVFIIMVLKSFNIKIFNNNNNNNIKLK